jgi:Ca-activated chloride channel homolog
MMLLMNIQTDRALVPAGATVVRYLVVTVTAPSRPRRAERPSVHIALVLDRSGSMGGRKLDLAKKAVGHAVQLLNERDRLAVVCYDDQIETLLGATAASAEAKTLAVERLRAIDARGSTDLCGGWLRGAQELESGAPASNDDVIRRVLLLSDGLANVGETNPAALAQHATPLLARGITTSTFGLGADFDEELMSNLSASGGGHFYFIEKPVQISDFFLSEIGEALEVVARDARVVIAGAPGIEISCLNEFPVERRSGGDVSIRLGDLTSEQEVTTIIGVRCTAGAIGSMLGISVRLADREHALFAEPMSVEWRVTDAIEDDAQPISAEVLIEVAKLLADGARTRALEANRRGDYDRAAEILRAEAAAIRALAPHVPEVQAIADDLFGERVLFQDAMSASEIKGRHFTSINAMYSRSPQGRARKRGAAS